MDRFTQSTKPLSPLLIFFTIALLLLLNACDAQNSASLQAVAATGTVAASTSQPTQQYEFTERDSGKTATYSVTSRFTIILNMQKYPKSNLQVVCSPARILGTISNIPSEAPPLYAVRYEGIQPGICIIKNGKFLLTVKIIALSSSIEPTHRKKQRLQAGNVQHHLPVTIVKA